MTRGWPPRRAVSWTGVVVALVLLTVPVVAPLGASTDLRLVAGPAATVEPPAGLGDTTLHRHALLAAGAAAPQPSRAVAPVAATTTTTTTTTTTPAPPAPPAPPVPEPSPPPPPPPSPAVEPPPAVLAVAAVPGGARLVDRLGGDPARRIASAALASVRYDWVAGLPGWELWLLDARRGYRGLTFPHERRIEVYVRDDDSPGSLAHVIAHELAHAVDVDRLDDGDRARWAHARSLRPGTPWWVGTGGSDFASGAGDLAESFAWWQTPDGHWHSRLGPPPTPLQLAVLAELTGAS